MKNNIRKLTYTALLTAIAIIIPTYFGFLSIKIPPFSATIASHVPMFLSMFFGPMSAAFVGLGSALGFLPTFGPVVAARAAMHIGVGVVGSLALRKGISFPKIIAITAPIHAILEAVVVIMLTGRVEFALVTVGIGTFLHHFVDGAISYPLVNALTKTNKAYFYERRKSA